MTTEQVTKNKCLVEDINFQLNYFSKVLLKQFSTAVHNSQVNDDVLVEEFYNKFYTSLIIELENYKEMFKHKENDLKFLEDNFEKALKLVDEIDDSIHQYELYLIITMNLSDSLLHQIDVEINKLKSKL